MRTIVIAVTLLLVTSTCFADTIVLKDGRQLQGKVVARSRGKIAVKTNAGELVMFKNDEVAKIVTGEAEPERARQSDRTGEGTASRSERPKRSITGKRTLTLGRDDLTGEKVTIVLGKKHPFVEWSRAEVGAFKTRLEDPDPAYNGVRYGWNHQSVGPPAKAERGDPVACGKVWQVTGDRAMAQRAAELLIKRSGEFDEDRFIKLGCWEAPRQLEECAVAYDLIAGAGVLNARQDRSTRDYLRAALAASKKLQRRYPMPHNMGFNVDEGAWSAALCLEDPSMLKELFARFKDTMGRALWPGGYWYEGTGYAYGEVRLTIISIVEQAARSGLDLGALNCKRLPLIPEWKPPSGHVRAGDYFEWWFRVVTPFGEQPNIGDGWGPQRLRSYTSLSHAKYTANPELLYRTWVRDLGLKRWTDPHTWGDYPPNPQVEPLDRLEDVAWPETGIFVFREGTGLGADDQYVLFTTIPRAGSVLGWHQHHDQGHINITRYGRWLTGDPESPCTRSGYQKLRSAFSATRWAHNTVVVAGEWGKPIVDPPKVHYASATDPQATVQVADVTIRDFTRGPTAGQRRRVLVTDDFIVVTDDLRASERTTFDWFFHSVNDAKWSLAEDPGRKIEPFIDYIPAHSEPDHDLRWHEACRTDEPWCGEFLVDEKERIALRVWQLDVGGGGYASCSLTPPRHARGSDPAAVYTGQRMYMICQRKEGKQAQFTAVLEPYRGRPRIESVQLVRNLPNDRVVQVTLADGRKAQISIGDGRYSVDMVE